MKQLDANYLLFKQMILLGLFAIELRLAATPAIGRGIAFLYCKLLYKLAGNQS